MRTCPECKKEKSDSKFHKASKIRACKACHRARVDNSDKARRQPVFTGNPEGKGQQHFPDGGHFAGRFKRGKRNGPGVYTFADGAAQIGTWVDGQLQIPQKEHERKYAKSQ